MAYRIDSRLVAPLILQPPRRCSLRFSLAPNVGVHVLEGRRRRRQRRVRHPQLGAPQLVQRGEDLVLRCRDAQLLRVARGQAQEVVVAGLQETEREKCY